MRFSRGSGAPDDAPASRLEILAPRTGRDFLARIVFFSLPLALSLAGVARADKYAGEFLRVPAGARAVGMGGAFVSLANDGSASWWNPAGLALLGQREILYQHAEQFGGAENYDFGSFSFPISKEGNRSQTAAVTLIRLGVDNIPVTPDPAGLRPGIDFEDDDGDPSTNLPTENNGRWDPGERLFLDAGSFRFASANDWALLGSYARPFGEKITAGASLKIVYRTLPDYSGDVSAWGAGLDAGMTYTVSPKLRLGFVAHDLTTTYMSWDTGTSEHVPPAFTVGGSYDLAIAPQHALTLALDVPFDFQGHEMDQYFGVGIKTDSTGQATGTGGLSGTFHAGAEYRYRGTLALRTGMMGRDLTFGAGFHHDKIGVDYAAVFSRFFGSDVSGFSGDGNLDVTHRISGSYRF
jgi:hypothetical protein